MKPHLGDIAELVAKADATFTAAIQGRGVDSHGQPIENLGEALNRALNQIEDAGEMVKEWRRNNQLTRCHDDHKTERNQG